MKIEKKIILDWPTNNPTLCGFQLLCPHTFIMNQSAIAIPKEHQHRRAPEKSFSSCVVPWNQRQTFQNAKKTQRENFFALWGSEQACIVRLCVSENVRSEDRQLCIKVF